MKRSLVWWTCCLLMAWFWVSLALYLMGTPASQRPVADGSPFDVDQNVVCFQTGYQDADCIRFDNVYHEDLLPFEIEGVNPDKKVLYIEVDEYFTSGSDGACQAFGALVLNMLEEMPDGWKLYITNEWVPSARNPIDKQWATVLAEGY